MLNKFPKIPDEPPFVKRSRLAVEAFEFQTNSLTNRHSRYQSHKENKEIFTFKQYITIHDTTQNNHMITKFTVETRSNSFRLQQNVYRAGSHKPVKLHWYLAQL